MTEPLSPVDLWTKITELPRPSKIVDYPRTDKNGKPIGQLAIVVLTQEEQMACSARAEELTRRLLKEKQITAKTDEARRGYEDIYNNACAVEILFRACKKADDIAASLFPTPDAIRAKLSADEIGVLMNMYFTVQSELGPIVAYMSDEEQDALIRRLVEGGSAFPLDLLSPEALRALTFSLASRLYASWTVTSSPGSPPESPPTSDSPPSETSASTTTGAASTG